MQDNNATQTLHSSTENLFNDSLESVVWKDENNNPIDNMQKHLNEKADHRLQEAIKKYIPVGSVVRLRGQIGLYVVIGYKTERNKVVFDYLAAKYPEGLRRDLPTYAFNHNDITQIHHVGMCDGTQKAYKEKLLEQDGGPKVGGTVLFGKYPFETENDIRPIEWIVLDNNESELLLISRYCLDTQGYCGTDSRWWRNNTSCVWETSYLRKWLNEVFYNRAFSCKEKENIIETRIVTDDSTDEALHQNKVFILSETQAHAYFPNCHERKAIPTPYAKANGARMGWTDDTRRYTSWWLLPHVKLTGGKPVRMDYPCAVFQMGETQYHSRNIAHTDFTVRPVIKIKK